MGDKQRNTIVRFAVIFLLITAGFIAVLVKIVLIQTKEKDVWLSLANAQIRNNQVVPATRGNILDCEGKLLCSSMPQYTLYMDAAVPALSKDNDSLFNRYIDTLSTDISRVLGDNDALYYKNKITTAHRRGRHNLRISRTRINYLQRKDLEHNPLIQKGKNYSGIQFQEVKRRMRLLGPLATRTLGSIDAESGYGKTGLEKQYDSYLVGKDGVSVRQRIAGQYENVTVVEAIDGYDIVTTLDAELQDIVSETLMNRLKRIDGEWGCCVLMETQSGHIKAIANLDKQPDGSYIESVNHAVTMVEPGSTFKTIALMAAMEDHKVDLYDTVSVTKAPWKYFTVTHRDAHPKDTVYTVRSALAVSSNIALAKIITRAYEGSANRFVNRVLKLGIADSVVSDIPGAQTALIRVPNDTVTISKMSYGYSVLVTPMQLLMFYNAIANEGKMVRPMLVTDIKDGEEIIKHFDTEVVKRSIARSSTLADIRLALHDVVWDNNLGTASVRLWNGKVADYKAQSSLVHIAGKTGTAQILENGRYSDRKHRITFVGYFPEENPQYTCICMINAPTVYGYDAGYDCGGVVRIIAEKTIANVDCYKNGTLVKRK